MRHFDPDELPDRDPTPPDSGDYFDNEAEPGDGEPEPEDFDEDFNPYECPKCGGSGGGDPPFRCPRCNGSGQLPKPKKEYDR
jgi:rubrerythrin